MVCVALALAHSRTPIYPLRPKLSRAGLEMRRMLSLIESQGLVERRDRLGEDLKNEEGEEGQSNGKRTERLAGRCGADQFSPPAYQSCPLTLSVSADDTLSLPIGPFPGQEKKRTSPGVCICLEGACLCANVHLGVDRGERRRRLASVKLSSPPGVPGEEARRGRQSGGPSGELDSASYSPRRASGGGSIQSLVNA